MNDFYSEYLKRSNKRNKLERKLDEYNHTMELIRTIIPIIVVILQTIILVKIW
jgi:heme/copper-type cytochrome/quinol oxidase subunit 2